MRWGNPFSFRGSIGRSQFWLTLVLLGVAQTASLAIPVAGHTVILTKFGGTGESSVGYATPVEPITARSWALLAAFYLIWIAVFWIMTATMAKRLHDLGRSGMWIAVVLGGLTAATIIQALFSKASGPLSAGDIASLTFFVPASLLGAFGLFEMTLIRGLGSRRTYLHPADLRRSTE